MIPLKFSCPFLIQLGPPNFPNYLLYGSLYGFLHVILISEPRRKNEDTEEAQKRRKQRAKKRKQQMQKKIEENKVSGKDRLFYKSWKFIIHSYFKF